MSTQVHIALIRGINVGRAKRVAMSDLRALIQRLGYDDVRTILNSGNVVFASKGPVPRDLAEQIEDAMKARLGVSARVMVFSARDISRVIEENPLPNATGDPSRYLVAFVSNTAHLKRLDALAKKSWTPETLALTRRAAYLHCPNGILGGELVAAVMGALGTAGTTRNWATVGRLQAVAATIAAG